MILYTPKSTYAVHFIHKHMTPKEHEKLKVTMGERALGLIAWTMCTVHEGKCRLATRPCETPNSLIGNAFCSRLDNFERSIGRKIAFSRAIETLPKAIRTALWRGYLLKFKIIGTHY